MRIHSNQDGEKKPTYIKRLLFICHYDLIGINKTNFGLAVHNVYRKKEYSHHEKIVWNFQIYWPQIISPCHLLTGNIWHYGTKQGCHKKEKFPAKSRKSCNLKNNVPFIIISGYLYIPQPKNNLQFTNMRNESKILGEKDIFFSL